MSENVTRKSFIAVTMSGEFNKLAIFSNMTVIRNKCTISNKIVCDLIAGFARYKDIISANRSGNIEHGNNIKNVSV